MRKPIAALLLASICHSSSQPASAVTIQWTTVGNPGNAADTVSADDGTSGYGAVGYEYRIGTYEVTNSQFVEFLNAKDPTGANSLGLYNGRMGQDANNAGISFASGSANGSKYSVISGHGNQPVNYVTWYDAIRFANWLNNGQGNGDTESGAYALRGGTRTPSNGNSITRNAGAKVFLPSEGEWYKAAYFNPVVGTYFRYPTSSDLTPTAEAPPGENNSANFSRMVNHLTDVGAYARSASPYGTFDQAGNAWEWNEALTSDSFRGLRGGSLDNIPQTLLDSYRKGFAAALDSSTIGFRVASIPELSK